MTQQHVTAMGPRCISESASPLPLRSRLRSRPAAESAGSGCRDLATCISRRADSGPTQLTLRPDSHSCGLLTCFLVSSPRTLSYLSSSTLTQEKVPQSNLNTLPHALYLPLTPCAAPSVPGRGCPASIHGSRSLDACPLFLSPSAALSQLPPPPLQGAP